MDLNERYLLLKLRLIDGALKEGRNGSIDGRRPGTKP